MVTISSEIIPWPSVHLSWLEITVVQCYLLLLLGTLSWAARGVHRVCGESRGCHHRNVQLPPTHQVQRVCCQRKYLWKSDRWAPRSHLWLELKIAEEWVTLSVLEAVWKCCNVLWMNRARAIVPALGDQAIQSWSALAAVPRDSSSPLFLHSLARSAFSLHLPLPWLRWFQRGCITVTPSLSLSVTFQHLNRETSFVALNWSLSKKYPHLSPQRCSLHCLLILNQSLFHTPARLAASPFHIEKYDLLQPREIKAFQFYVVMFSVKSNLLHASVWMFFSPHKLSITPGNHALKESCAMTNHVLQGNTLRSFTSASFKIINHGCANSIHSNYFKRYVWWHREKTKSNNNL